jgi:uncharacterized protein (DUF2267 family)
VNKPSARFPERGDTMPVGNLSFIIERNYNTCPWIDDVAQTLGWQNKHRAFQALRVTLLTLRDYLTIDEVNHLGQQLPVWLAVYYYVGWQPHQIHPKLASGQIGVNLHKSIWQALAPVVSDAEVKLIAQAVIRVLCRRLPERPVITILHKVSRQLESPINVNTYRRYG